MQLKIFAPAKVNLCLHVGPARADGYHPLVTIMQPLSVGDWLTITPGDGGGFSLSCNLPELQTPANLVLKAAHAWQKASGSGAGAHIHLEKLVPMAAGLGGGSSDAAATLMALNALFEPRLDPQALVELALGLGADVPFFLAGTTALCQGIGEKVTPLPDFPALDYVLVNPGFAVSTAQVYQDFDSCLAGQGAARAASPGFDPRQPIEDRREQTDLTWTNPSPCHRIDRSDSGSLPEDWLLVNGLEPVTIKAHPELAAIKGALHKAGAKGALMSGSGPTVFGIFEGPREAKKAANELARPGAWWVRACRAASG